MHLPESKEEIIRATRHLAKKASSLSQTVPLYAQRGDPAQSLLLQLKTEIQTLLHTIDKEPTYLLQDGMFLEAYADLLFTHGEISMILGDVVQAYKAFSVLTDIDPDLGRRATGHITSAECIRRDMSGKLQRPHLLEQHLSEALKLAHHLRDIDLMKVCFHAFNSGPFSPESITNARLICEKNCGDLDTHGVLMEVVLLKKIGLDALARSMWGAIRSAFTPIEYPATNAYIEWCLRIGEED